MPPRSALAFALLWAAVLAGGAPAHAGGVTGTYEIPVAEAPARGPDDAPITIVEFSDFRCRYCVLVQATLQQLDRLYPGKVRLVYRQSPLDLEEGTLAAEASLAAAAQGRFWPMHDRIFTGASPHTREVFEMYAAELGLDLVRFRDDLDRGRHRPQVVADASLAHSLGAYSTPYFFINGRPVRGAQPLRVFARVIEEELSRAAELSGAGVPGDRLYEALVADAGRDGMPGAVEGGDRLEAHGTYRVGLGLPGHELGPEDALVTIVKFTDLECPYCRRAAPTIEAVRARFPDEVRVVYRHLPLAMHGSAQLAAEAAVEAGRQGRFWPYVALLYGNQGSLGRAELERHGEAVGLDMDALRAALDDRRHLEAVRADAAAGAALGVSGTPTTFVNGSPVVGATTIERLSTVVEIRLDQARALVTIGVDRRDVYAMVMNAADDGELGGDPTRVPSATSAVHVEMVQGDYQAAAIAACRSRDPVRAAAMMAKVKKKAHREQVRAGCRPFGVDLGD